MVGDRVVVGYVVGASADIWRSRWCGLEPATMGVWQEGCEPRGSADWKKQRPVSGMPRPACP